MSYRATTIRIHRQALAYTLLLLAAFPASAGEWRYEGQTFTGSSSPIQAGEAGAPSALEEDDPASATTQQGTVEALETEVAANPNDANLILSLAQAHAERQQPGEALQYCLRAADIEPDNLQIRRHCARYAEWAGDLSESLRQFKRLLELAPGDEEGLLGAARAHGWSGKLGPAADYYKRYLELDPDNPEAWIEYAQVRAWQGNFAAAIEALDEYRQRYGETDRYLEEKARYLAWDNRPRRAMEINTPLLEKAPDDYERLYTRAVALAADSRTGAALDSIEKLSSLRPDSEDTQLLRRAVRTPTRPSVTVGWHYYNDSDTIKIQRWQADARLPVTTRASLQAGAATDTLEAGIGSGFETIGGEDSIRYDQAWLGASYRFNPMLAVAGRIGRGDIEDADTFTPYQVALDASPVDSTELSLTRRRELYALSPRAVSQGITREHNELAVNWRPGYRYVIEAAASYDELSDGNEQSRFVLAPRRAVLRTGEINADLGAHLTWSAFDEDLNNGYYDPTEYQRYAGSLFGYWKLSEDDGVSLVTTAGFHKDDEMNDYEFGSDVVVELTTGLYDDWMSVVTVDYSDRYQAVGSYDGWNVRMGLTGRF